MSQVSSAASYPKSKSIRILMPFALPTVLQLLFLLLLCFLVLYPVGMIVYGAFRSGSPYGPTHFTLQGLQGLIADPDVPKFLANTLLLAVARTFGAVGLAVFLAWLIYRSDLPGWALFEKFILFRYFIPPLVVILAWILLLAPSSGMVNTFLQALGVDHPIFDIFSYWGIIWAGVLGWSNLIFLMIGPAFQNMDASLEEASVMSGASNMTTLRRIVVPLLQPVILAMLLLSFVRMLSSFEPELFLGSRAGIFVFTTRIYRSIAMSPPNFPSAMAMGNLLLVVAVVLVVAQWRILGRREFTTVTGRGFMVRRVALGRWRWPAFAFIVVFILTTLILPLATLIVGSFMKVSGVFMNDMWTLKHWQVILNEPRVVQAVLNTVLMAGVAATLGTTLSGLAAYIVIRTKFGGRRVVDLVVWLPFVTPATVMGLGFLWAYTVLPMPVPIYGTVFLMMLAFTTVGLPLGTRTITSGMIQISKELEESSRVHGASWTYTFLHIWLPLLKGSFIGAWAIIFALTVWDLNIAAILYGPKSETVSTLIFDYFNSGYVEQAVILGFIQAALTASAFFLCRLAGGRTFATA